MGNKKFIKKAIFILLITWTLPYRSVFSVLLLKVYSQTIIADYVCAILDFCVALVTQEA